MNEETFKKILYLIFKITIKNSGFLSQLEIFRDVRYLMNKYFNIKESDLIVRVGQGKNEDFKDILNFILTILCELALVSQKMENKSFYFKWTGFKGFRKKYFVDFVTSGVTNFEMSESFEHRIQIYTRLLLLNLIDKRDEGINYDQVDELVKRCGLDGQNRHTEKIHAILKFIDFIIGVGENGIVSNTASNIIPSKPSHQIFTLLPKDNPSNRGDQIVFKINKTLLDENLGKDANYAEKFYPLFNENILSKFTQWSEEILKNEGISENQLDDNKESWEEELTSQDNINKQDSNKNFNSEINANLNYSLNSLAKGEINELDQYKVNINNFNTENEEAGFALLRGNNWCYYIKKLYCIIGRAPIKYGVAFHTEGNTNLNSLQPTSNYGNTTWHVDVDLGQNRKISKQHALIAYNFQTCTFEIQNLSKKHNIKVNGEPLKYNEEMPLSSKSLIGIGNQEFYFLLPL